MPRARKSQTATRQPTPTVDYNRNPQPVTVPKGQAYGAAQASQQAQAAIPVAGQANTSAPPPAPTPQAAPAGDAGLLAAAQQYAPNTGDLLADSTRPGEPVTAGLPDSPGAGPESIGISTGQPSQDDLVGMQLRALYQAHPSNQVLHLIELHDRGY